MTSWPRWWPAVCCGALDADLQERAAALRQLAGGERLCHFSACRQPRPLSTVSIGPTAAERALAAQELDQRWRAKRASSAP